nr:premnaspirodiene oxygenase-like [Ipomoea batatas]
MSGKKTQSGELNMHKSRLQLLSSKIILYNCSDIVMSLYDDHLCKICVMELLNPKLICSFNSIRNERSINGTNFALSIYPFLSPLEIKELDAIGKDKAEEKNPGNMNSCNYTKEVIIKSQVIFEIVLHFDVCSPGNGHRIRFVTNLRLLTYRSWNEKPGEEIPKADEERHDDSRNVVAWSEGDEHHSASVALSDERLGVFCWEVKVLGTRGWTAQLLDDLLIPPDKMSLRITIAAALASRPDVGSSMKMMDGLATSSTATVNRFLCSVERPSTPGSPTRESLKGFSSTSSITCSMNIYTDRHTQYKSILPLARN